MANTSLFDCVTTFHHQLNEIFLLHQEALLINALPLAAEFLASFRELIELHIEIENQHINAAHATSVSEPRWKTSLYLAEHDKILSLIEAVSFQIAHKLKQPEKLRQTGHKDQNRWIIDLLDKERTLKNVIEHHEEREEKGLLKELEEHLDQPALAKLVSTCQFAWQEILHKKQSQIEDLTRNLRALAS